MHNTAREGFVGGTRSLHGPRAFGSMVVVCILLLVQVITLQVAVRYQYVSKYPDDVWL